MLPLDLSMKNFTEKESRNQNRQEFPQYYEINGAIHIARWNILKESADWYGDNSFGYLLEEPYFLDIRACNRCQPSRESGIIPKYAGRSTVLHHRLDLAFCRSPQVSHAI